MGCVSRVPLYGGGVKGKEHLLGSSRFDTYPFEVSHDQEAIENKTHQGLIWPHLTHSNHLTHLTHWTHLTCLGQNAAVKQKTCDLLLHCKSEVMVKTNVSSHPKVWPRRDDMLSPGPFGWQAPLTMRLESQSLWSVRLCEAQGVGSWYGASRKLVVWASWPVCRAVKQSSHETRLPTAAHQSPRFPLRGSMILPVKGQPSCTSHDGNPGIKHPNFCPWHCCCSLIEATRMPGAPEQGRDMERCGKRGHRRTVSNPRGSLGTF